VTPTTEQQKDEHRCLCALQTLLTQYHANVLWYGLYIELSMRSDVMYFDGDFPHRMLYGAPTLGHIFVGAIP